MFGTEMEPSRFMTRKGGSIKMTTNEVNQLPWSLTCDIACRAMLLNITFEQAVQILIRQYLEVTKGETDDKS
jgi:hypothetical protein